MLARNWRCDVGEIDLIVRTAGQLVFVEVKARFDDRFGPPSSAVGFAKQRTIRRVAARWLATTAHDHADLRFDVVAVTGTHVEVIEAAF